MKERIVDTLLELIAIDSDSDADKGPVVDYAIAWLEGLGMKVIVTGPDDTPAIMATTGEGGITLSGHLDTVPVGEGWSKRQGQLDNGRIYGRGASDMKGAVATTLEVACALTEESVPFSVMLTTDEEEGMLGALALAQEGALERSRGVIIGEPTGMRVASMEKGVYRVRLTARGMAGHSSQPWTGRNAIMKMHRILGSMWDLIEVPASATEGRTATVTTIEGGTKNNVIPDRCAVEIDIRFPPSESLEENKEMMAQRIDGHDVWLEATAELESFQAPMGSALIEEAIDYLDTVTFPAMFATEAARFAPHNPEIVVCGPGTPGTCHIADEWVETENLERFHDFLLHMARFAAQG